MAIGDTIVTYAGNGLINQFSIPFAYEDEGEVVVARKNGSVTYIFLNANTIQLVSPALLGVGDTLTISRVTDIDTPASVFRNSSAITGTQLNASFSQILKSLQEQRDLYAFTLRIDIDQNAYDIENRRLLNVGVPLAASDGARLADVTAAVAAIRQVPNPTGGDTGRYLRATGAGTFAWDTVIGGGGTAATTTFSPAGNIAATNVQTAIQELDTEKAPVTHTHTASQISDASANGRSLITAADYAAMRSLLGLSAGGTVTVANITDASPNGRSLISAADYAAMRTLLGLGSGSTVTVANITDASANGRSLISAADYAAMRTLLGFTTTNITDMSANGRSLVTAANYAAMKTLLTLVAADIADASANGRSFIQAADYAAMRTLLGFTTANITDMSANGRSLVSAADYAAMRTLLGFTTTNITDMSADGRSLVTAVSFAAMRTALGLGAGATATLASQSQAEAGTDNTTLMTPLRTAEAITALGGGGGGGVPAGTIVAYAGKLAPSGWLLCDGSNQSRTTFSTLFNAICPVIGTFTVTIASPGVATLTNHGLFTGDRIRLTTTGALPTGLVAGTDYFINRIDANTFRFRATQGGTDINTSGTQSGVHTAQLFAYGAGDGSTTFGIPDLRGRVPVGADAMGGTGASRITSSSAAQMFGQALGSAGGGQDQVLTTAMLASHSHNVNLAVGGTSGGTITNVQVGTPNPVTASNTVTANAGSGNAHSNLQPSLITSYIIKT